MVCCMKQAVCFSCCTCPNCLSSTFLSTCLCWTTRPDRMTVIKHQRAIKCQLSHISTMCSLDFTGRNCFISWFLFRWMFLYRSVQQSVTFTSFSKKKITLHKYKVMYTQIYISMAGHGAIQQPLYVNCWKVHEVIIDLMQLFSLYKSW